VTHTVHGEGTHSNTERNTAGKERSTTTPQMALTPMDSRKAEKRTLS